MDEKTPLQAEETKNSDNLSAEQLDRVTGAGNPFKPIPRVPDSPIDSDLRKKA